MATVIAELCFCQGWGLLGCHHSAASSTATSQPLLSGVNQPVPVSLTEGWKWEITLVVPGWLCRTASPGGAAAAGPDHSRLSNSHVKTECTMGTLKEEGTWRQKVD